MGSNCLPPPRTYPEQLGSNCRIALGSNCRRDSRQTATRSPGTLGRLGSNCKSRAASRDKPSAAPDWVRIVYRASPRPYRNNWVRIARAVPVKPRPARQERSGDWVRIVNRALRAGTNRARRRIGFELFTAAPPRPYPEQLGSNCRGDYPSIRDPLARSARAIGFEL